MRKPYVEWSVNDNTYRLKLTTSDIMKLEEELGTNLISMINNHQSLPSLTTMLKVTQQAMNSFHHGIKLQDVCELFDAYCDEDGSQMSFMTDVFLPIYQASGFFSNAQAQAMMIGLETAKEQM